MKVYKIKLRTKTPLIIGGVTPDPIFDEVTAIRDNNTPFIPASAFKGALRIAFESLMRSMGVKVCDFSSEKEEQNPNKSIKAGCGECIACRLFGGGGKEGKLRFTDLEGSEIKDFEIRTQVTISRKTGKAVQKHLFFRKFAPPGVEFKGEIIAKNLSPEEDERWSKFLKLIEKTGLSIGGSKTVGMGEVEIEVTERLHEERRRIESLYPDEKDWGFFQLRIKFYEPLNIGYRRVRYVIPTLKYIPASTIRGAIAFALLNAGAKEDEIRSLFADETKENLLRFSNFYIKQPHPNFATEKKPKRESIRSKRDTLMHDYLLYLQTTQNQFNNELFETIFYSDNSGKPLEPVETDPGEAKVYLYTKLFVNRQSGSTQEGKLYTIEALRASADKPLIMEGYIYAPKSWENVLEGLQLYVGGRRTKGFGGGEIEIVSQIHDFDKYLERAEKFNTKLHEMAEQYEISVPSDRKFFTLDLLSELALPEEKTFRDYLTESFREIDDFRIERVWLRKETRGGFDALKSKDGNIEFKPRRDLIKRGSVVLLSVHKNYWDKTSEILSDLLKTGIGYKPFEGYGFFTICHETHL